MNSLKKISDYLYSQRWCNFKSEITEHNLRHVTFDILPFDKDKILAVGHAEFAEKDDSYFMMPMKQADENTSDKTLDFEGIAYKDAVEEEDFWPSLMNFLEEKGYSVEIPGGWRLEFNETDDSNKIRDNMGKTSTPLHLEQSNTTVVVGNQELAFKLERMLSFSKEENPEFEMNKKLMRENSSVMPKTHGILVLHNDKGETSSSGIIQEFVKNKGDMWNYSVAYIKEKLRQGYETQTSLTEHNCPEFMRLIDNLGLKTQEMFDALSKDDDNPNFTPQEADDRFLHIYQNQMKVLLFQTKRNIAENVDSLPEPTKSQTRRLLKGWDKLTSNFVNQQVGKIERASEKEAVCRVHGDFHLGQVLVTKDDDLKFIDFAGEPALPIEQRKQKHISVRDYAGMYRSISGYLGAVAAEEFAAEGATPEEIAKRKAYAQKAVSPLINKASQRFLRKHTLNEPWLSLEVFRKNLYEVNYEVCNRPQMAYVPISGLNTLLSSGGTSLANRKGRDL